MLNRTPSAVSENEDYFDLNKSRDTKEHPREESSYYYPSKFEDNTIE